MNALRLAAKSHAIIIMNKRYSIKQAPGNTNYCIINVLAVKPVSIESLIVRCNCRMSDVKYTQKTQTIVSFCSFHNMQIHELVMI